MIARSGKLLQPSRPLVIFAVALSTLAVDATSVWPQASSPGVGIQGQPPAASEAEPAPAQPAESPGLWNDMGRALRKILPPLKTPGETLDDLNGRAKDAAKDAGESLSRLTTPSSMVTGRTICLIAANGTPDCKTAADKLCQSKGYKEGKSLNTDSAETCSPKVLIPGRKRKPDDCRTDNYITSALCQ